MPEIHNFAEAHQALAIFIPRNAKPGSYSLERMQALMSKLGNPQDTYRVVHVAGTSGKTSTCYYLAAQLQQAGKKVGMTVSPHVDEVNERVQIGLTPLPEYEFCQKLGEFMDVIQQTGIEPTYFELLIAFAYWQFAQRHVDYAVVEVGLGGLVDGTNVVSREDKVCVITDIGLDHTNVLGSTMGEIATQKAGVIQSHNAVFMYRQGKEVMKSVIARSGRMHAQLHEIKMPADSSLPAGLPPFQQRNWWLAKTAIDYVTVRDGLAPLSPAQLAETAAIIVPARLETMKIKDKTVIIDGSHNGQKMAAAVAGIQRLFPNQPVDVLVSFVESERGRANGALKELLKLTDSIIITSFSGEQDTPKHSVSPATIASSARKLGFRQTRIIQNPKDAFTELIKQSRGILLITGSFYLLNHIRPLIFDVK